MKSSIYSTRNSSVIKLFLIIATICSIPITGAGQDLEYAREVVNTLCSDKMKGRGYVENGDRNAAQFIAGEYEKAGLKKYSKNYFQQFSTPVNSFPGKMELSVNGKKLVPGEDFLVDAGSPSISGTFPVVPLTADDLLKDVVWSAKVRSASGKFFVISAYNKDSYNKDQLKRITDVTSFLQYNPENPAKGTIVLTNNKLTWSGSTELGTKSNFIIKSASITGAPEKIEVNVENKFLKSHESQNVVGFIEGTLKDSLLVFTAHYDHLGMMGKQTMFPGANDNASGIALLLNLVKHYSAEKPKYTTVFIAFGGEEIGLIGSKYFTEHPLFSLKKIKFLINFDLAGTGDDGIQVVNGKVYQSKFDALSKINNERSLLKQIKIRGEACNSDHCMFHSKGVPCFYIYTLGGIQAYHDIYDRAETLPFTEFEDYFKLITEFISKI